MCPSNEVSLVLVQPGAPAAQESVLLDLLGGGVETAPTTAPISLLPPPSTSGTLLDLLDMSAPLMETGQTGQSGGGGSDLTSGLLDLLGGSGGVTQQPQAPAGGFIHELIKMKLFTCL